MCLTEQRWYSFQERKELLGKGCICTPPCRHRALIAGDTRRFLIYLLEQLVQLIKMKLLQHKSARGSSWKAGKACGQ